MQLDTNMNWLVQVLDQLVIKKNREALLNWIIKVWENNETISPQIAKN